jgi:hypothetical protein
MTKEWANKDKYHPSNGVLKPLMQMPRAKVIVRTIPDWGDRKVASSAASRAPPVRPVLVWADSGSADDRFGVGDRGSGGWHGESSGGQFARRSPPCAQYEGGKSRSFETERRNDP